MGYVDNYFRRKTKELSFIELRDGSSLNLKNYIIEGDFPMPVITDNLIEEIQKGNLQEEIPLKNIIDGIIYLLGIDKDFIHSKKYREILESYDDKILDYIFYKGMDAFERGSFDEASVCFRTLIYLEPNNIKGIFNYALALEELAKIQMEKGKTEEGSKFLLESTNKLESILDIDANFSVAYYKLGYHYKYSGQYLKAKITWSKFLTLHKEESMLQEIREELSLIDEDARVEAGISYLTYNQFGKALDQFLKLMPKHEDNWNINYFIGLCYKGLEEYDVAIEYLTAAIDLNNEVADIYNELGIIFFSNGDIAKALTIFSEGIDNCEEDYKLFFNRGLAYIQLGQFELALNDITKAHTLNPNDVNVLSQKEK